MITTGPHKPPPRGFNSRPCYQPSAACCLFDSLLRVNRPQRLGGTGTRYRSYLEMCQRGLMDRIANPWSRKRLVRSNRTISAKVFQGDVAHQVRAAVLQAAGIRFEAELLHHLYILHLGRSPSWPKASGFEPDNSMVRIHHDLPDFHYL
jgi:hypothetical protein